METEKKNSPDKKISKNQLFKKRVIINPDELKEQLSEIESNQSTKQYNESLYNLFDEDKFTIRDDFDRNHCKEFLKEKDKFLQPIKFDEFLCEDDNEKIEVYNRISPKFTFGRLL